MLRKQKVITMKIGKQVNTNFSFTKVYFIIIYIDKQNRNIYFQTDLEPYHPHSILSSDLTSGYDNLGRSFVTYYHCDFESITRVHSEVNNTTFYFHVYFDIVVTQTDQVICPFVYEVNCQIVGFQTAYFLISIAIFIKTTIVA